MVDRQHPRSLRHSRYSVRTEIANIFSVFRNGPLQRRERVFHPNTSDLVFLQWPCTRTVPRHFSNLPFIPSEDSNVTVNSVVCHAEVQHLSFLPPSSRAISPSPPLLNSIPMPGLNTKVQKFEGWHYDVIAGVVPRRRVHG